MSIVTSRKTSLEKASKCLAIRNVETAIIKKNIRTSTVSE